MTQEPRMNRIPRVRQPASQETSELHDPELKPAQPQRDRWTELGHTLLEWTCKISTVALIIGLYQGWFPPG